MPRYGNTDARGYGNEHQRRRREWEPIVATGRVLCSERLCLEARDKGEAFRLIAPDAEWDLAHDFATGTWLGPAHRRCNRSEGASRGNRMRAMVRRFPPPPSGPLRTSRAW